MVQEPEELFRNLQEFLLTQAEIQLVAFYVGGPPGQDVSPMRRAIVALGVLNFLPVEQLMKRVSQDYTDPRRLAEFAEVIAAMQKALQTMLLTDYDARQAAAMCKMGK